MVVDKVLVARLDKKYFKIWKDFAKIRKKYVHILKIQK